MTITRYGSTEELVNNYQNTLNGSITDVATTVTVDDATGLPTRGDFVCLVESELIRFNGGGTSGNILSVRQRGAEGTTAAAHNDGLAITAVLTNESLQKYLLGAGGNGAGYSQKTVPTASFPLNRTLDENNNILTVSDFTWLNQGGATAQDANGGIVITMPSEANHNIRGLYRDVPTQPFVLKCKVRTMGPSAPGGTSSHFGLFLYDLSANEIITMTARYGEAVWMAAWNSPTSFNSFVDCTGGNTCMNSIYPSFPVWFRLILDAGGEVEGYVSYDGNSWSRNTNASWQGLETSIFPSGGTTEKVGFYANSGLGIAGQKFIFESFSIEEQ